MRSFLALTLLAAGASTAAALAVPAMSEIEVMKRNIIDRQKLRKRQLVTSGADDATILNFALTLEHLEAKFYADAIAKYNETSFASAGFGGLYPVLEQVGRDETAHVEFLTTALKAAGVTPVQACNYTFPYTDVASFLALSQVIEGVGVSAYLGAAGDINNTQYLTAAGSILTVEARHAAAIQLINGYQPASQPFDTPLDAASVVTLVSPFFKSCPTGSAPTIEGNPALNVTTAAPEFGGSLSIAPVNSSILHSGSNVYCGFASGLALEFTPYSTSNYSCPIPHSGNITAGQTYVVLTTNNTASSIIAGPAIVILGQEKNLTFSINNTATASQNSSSSSSGGSKASQGSTAAAVSGGSNGAGALHVGGAAGILAAVVGGLAVLL